MRLRLPILAAALVLAACGDTDDGGPPTTVGCKDAVDGEVTLVAQDGNRWDTDCLRAPAGPLTIVVDNQDDGGNHNVHLAGRTRLAGHRARAGPVDAGAGRHPRARAATSTSATSTPTWWARSASAEANPP